MGLVNGIKLGLAINAKLKQVRNVDRDREAILKAFLESIESQGQFTVVEWSVLGKQLEVFGNGKE